MTEIATRRDPASPGNPGKAPLSPIPSPAIGWRKERVYTVGDEYFTDMIAEIEAAQFSVRLETYIFKDDALGRRIAAALMATARRGVAVRLLVDGIGSPQWPEAFLHELRQAGVEVRIYHPAPWHFFRHLKSAILQIERAFESVRILNRRNHRKTCIIDDRAAWAGSLNIDIVHLRSISGRDSWRDTGVRVEGGEVKHLVSAFEDAWRRSVGLWSGKRRWLIPRPKEDPRSRQRLVRLNYMPPARKRSYRDLIHRIRHAGQRVWITNAYFIPEGELLRALYRAARRRRDVRIIVPRNTDIFFMRWVSSAFYYGLLRAGVRIFEYCPSMLHAKSAIIDDWVIVGSSNLNYRSLVHDLEADVVLTHEGSRDKLVAQFESDLSNSAEVTLEDWKNRSRVEKFLGRFLLVLRYFL